MSQSAWRYAFASVVGTSHSRQGLPLQDSSRCDLLRRAEDNSAPVSEDNPILVAVVSDGAGSAVNSAIGSQLACELFVAEIRAIVETGGDVADVTLELVQQWLTNYQAEVSRRAEAAELTTRDYACTFLAAVVGDKRSAFVQIGDGAIVVSGKNQDEHNCVFWPQRGEYENMTNFATDPAAINLIFHKIDDWPTDQIALFTDGLQRLALHFETRTAYAPFFGPMFAPLHKSPVGYSESLSASLGAFLNSQAVSSRTDDDKTLILATRRSTIGWMPAEAVSDEVL